MNKRITSILFLLIAIAAVPLTVYVAQRQQETRQRAASSFTVSCSPSQTSAIINQTSISWTATTNPPDDGSFTYSWTDTDNSTTNPYSTFSTVYHTLGGKSASVTVSDPNTGEIASSPCNNTVTVTDPVSCDNAACDASCKTAGGSTANGACVNGSCSCSIPPPIPPSVTIKPYLAEDINQDYKVDISDFEIWRSNYTEVNSNSRTINVRADVNGDGIINLLDFNRWFKKFKELVPNGGRY